ncbi:hypothetical protein [uncultured Dysosmobacter sp.]|uniref:hypothetical protein n=1 Tax=uncultured Dysosmobacter sp. TaxID=2591384 RepID=UPI002605CA2E|nr:hypothetical protein [uncultured Dysosmobacter sp.]
MKHTLEEAMSYAIETKAMGILEKEGSYQTAKDWREIDYAVSCGWKYIGHPADLQEG